MICLLTFPKSGSTLIRYIIERLINRATVNSLQEKNKSVSKFMGLNHVYINYKIPPIVLKKHYFSKVVYKCEMLILLLRDPLEVILSYYYSRLKIKKSYRNYLKSLKIKSLKPFIIKYIKNIKTYQNWKGEKEIIYYSDLIDNPEKIIKKIANVLNIDSIRTEEIIQDYPKDKKDVMNFKLHKSGLKINTKTNKEFFSTLIKDNKQKKFWKLFNNVSNNMKVDFDRLYNIKC